MDAILHRHPDFGQRNISFSGKWEDFQLVPRRLRRSKPDEKQKFYFPTNLYVYKCQILLDSSKCLETLETAYICVRFFVSVEMRTDCMLLHIGLKTVII